MHLQTVPVPTLFLKQNNELWPSRKKLHVSVILQMVESVLGVSVSTLQSVPV